MNQSSRVIPSFQRDRAVIVSTLLALTILAWIYTFFQAREMACMKQDMPGCAMPGMLAWTATDFWVVFVMWVVMMVAMMLPSAIPMVLTFAYVNRQQKEKENPFVPTWIFVLGYLAVWTLFSASATGLQWYLHQKALLSAAMILKSNVLSGSVLILAGVFQLTPLKNACLNHCRSPFSFLMTDWRQGRWGAFVMGWRHGWYCTGCCWILMLLLFALGIMNLFWIAALSLFVLVEKISPKSLHLNYVAGIFLIVWGIVVILK